MKICLLYSKEDFPIPQRRGFLRGVFSYVARGDSLFAEKQVPLQQADVLVISAKNLSEAASAAICNEAKKSVCRAIFIDSENPLDADILNRLSEGGFEVFSPYSKKLPGGTIPVIETEISGGSLSEYLESARVAFPRFSVSVRRSAFEIALPADGKTQRELSQKALRLLISSFEPDIFFSPQLMCKYFLINRDRDSVRLILFDDAETVSGKLRLAKKHGASHAFLVYREIADIFDDISF